MNQLSKSDNRVVAARDYTQCPITMYIIENYDKLFSVKKKVSRDTYKRNGLEFVNFLKKEGGFDDTILERYIEHIEGLMVKKGNVYVKASQSYKASKCTSCRIIIKRVNHFKQDLIPDSIFKRLMSDDLNWIKSPSESTRTAPSRGDIELIKDSLTFIEDPYKKSRYLAEFVLMGFQGLRASEVIKLSVNDLSLRDRTISVTRKRGKQSAIQLHKFSLDTLKHYVNYNGIESGYLFTKKESKEHVTRHQLSMKWKRFMSKVGLGQFSPHSFRHYLGTYMAEETGDAWVVQQILGHSSLRTSQRYVGEAKKRQAIEKAHELLKW